MKTKLTFNEYLQLTGLLTLAVQHNSQLRQIARAVVLLTGDREEGQACDGVYSDYTADEILVRLGMTFDAPEGE